jgi:hypothetical protein
VKTQKVLDRAIEVQIETEIFFLDLISKVQDLHMPNSEGPSHLLG